MNNIKNWRPKPASSRKIVPNADETYMIDGNVTAIAGNCFRLKK